MSYPQPETIEAALNLVRTVLVGQRPDAFETAIDFEDLPEVGRRGWNVGYDDAGALVDEVFRVVTGREPPDVDESIASEVALSFTLEAVK